MFQNNEYDFIFEIAKNNYKESGEYLNLDIYHGNNVFFNNLQTLIPEENKDTLIPMIKRSREISELEKTLEVVTFSVDARKRIQILWENQEKLGQTEKDTKLSKLVNTSVNDIAIYEELEERCRIKLAKKKGLESMEKIELSKRKILINDILKIILLDQGIYGEILFRRYLLSQPELLKKSKDCKTIEEFLNKKELTIEDIEKLWFNQIHTLMQNILYALSESVEVQMSNEKYPETKTPYTEENSVEVINTKILKEQWKKCSIEHWTAFYLVTDYDRSFSDLARLAPNFVSLTYLRRMFLDNFDRSNLPKGTHFPKIPYSCKPVISTVAQMFYNVEMGLWAASVGSAIKSAENEKKENYKARPFIFGDVFLREKRLEGVLHWLKKDNQYIYRLKSNSNNEEIYTNITEKNGKIIISSEGDIKEPIIHNWIDEIEHVAAEKRKFVKKPFEDTYEIFIASRKLNDAPENLFTYAQSVLNRAKAYAAYALSEKPLTFEQIENIEKKQILAHNIPEAKWWHDELKEASEKTCDFLTWM